MKQITCGFVRHVIDGRCAWCFWTLYSVCVTCLSSELGKTESQLPGHFHEQSLLLTYNSTFPCRVHPCPFSVACLELRPLCPLAVAGGRERNVILKVSTVQTCSTASKASEICHLLCPDWHGVSYSHTVRFLAEHLTYLWAVMKDLLCSKRDISNYSF